QWAHEQNAHAAVSAPNPLAKEFEPPYTTLHVGEISGGTAHNITAKDCQFDLSFRVVPGETLTDWEAKLRAKADEITAR
ncbi:peptidase dimerization domain-containing protein, partial [Escherichia coli]|nr:peptidase dimerization domain-containing protein [Escherichia coli]